MASNNQTTESNMSQPTIADVFNLLKTCASKEDLTTITTQIQTFANDTTSKIQTLEARVENVTSSSSQNTDRIESLEATVECLKQDQLKNNMCISGVPPELIKDSNTADAVIAIAKALNIDMSRQQFSSYGVANNKFIIVHVYNIKYKQMMINKIRAKKSLMVEEAFQIKSNSQIYLNDHLTPYFSSLFLMARKAKKEGKLASASSYGGKIRARKSHNDAPMIITSERQLLALIEHEYDLCSDSDNSVHTTGSDADNSIKTLDNEKINGSNKSKKQHKNNRHPNTGNNTQNTRRATRNNARPTKRKLESDDSASQSREKQKKATNK